jgi:hypothetical protein
VLELGCFRSIVLPAAVPENVIPTGNCCAYAAAMPRFINSAIIVRFLMDLPSFWRRNFFRLSVRRYRRHQPDETGHVLSSLGRRRRGPGPAYGGDLPELRRMARRYLNNEALGNSLQATALVHELSYKALTAGAGRHRA